MFGKEIQTPITFNNNTMDVSNLSDGICIVNIFTEAGMVTKKRIVKR